MRARARGAGTAYASGAGGNWLWLVLLWLVATLTALATRPLIPVDELRYAAVAWEMWSRGDFLVPYLNGEPYSHKPPLFFWLIHAFWWLFGVSDLVMRMVAPLLLLLNLWLAAGIGRLLWPHPAQATQLGPHPARAAHLGPQHAQPARMVPWVLCSCAFLLGFSAWVQTDLLLMCAVLLALHGVLRAAQDNPSGWWLTGVAIGLGLLAKGPVVLLHVLPVIWLAPLWRTAAAEPRWPAWYAGSLFSILLGAGIALAWAWPAAQAGGVDYRAAIFWGQTAQRVVVSFAHAHAWWWYLPWLPVLFAPWIMLPWVWRAARAALVQPDSGVRFCVTWLLATLLLLSLVSGKQVKYLLPVLPGFALLMARVLAGMPRRPVAGRPWLPALVLVVLGVAGMILPLVLRKAPWLNEVQPLWGGVLLLLAAALWRMPALLPERHPRVMAVLALAMLVVGETGVLRIGAPSYDLRHVSTLIAAAQAEGRAIATTARYHGEFSYPGRLREPVREISRQELREWVRDNPRGILVVTGKQSCAGLPGVRYHQRYQSGHLALVDVGMPGVDPGRMPDCAVSPANYSETTPE